MFFLRLIHADQSTWEIDLTVVTPVLGLSSWPLAVGAVVGRRWRLAPLAIVVACCWVAWEAPVLSPFGRRPAPSLTAQPWRLFDANVAQDNVELSGIAGEIERDRPDVVALQELNPLALASLQATAALAGYRWKLAIPRFGAGGMGLWSRLPVHDLRSWTAEGTQVEIDAWIEAPGGTPVRLDEVHVYAPVGSGQPAEWRRQLGQVRHHLRAEPGPLVVTGDFNATADLGPFQQVLHLGLADAAVLSGRGWEMTWPRDQAWVPPYLRLDHVLVSSQLTVTRYELGHGQGSDHRPLVVDVAPRRSAPSS